MRLGSKSRDLLEILSMLSVEALEAVFSAPRLYKFGHCSSPKSLRERLNLIEGNGWIVWDDSRTSGTWVAKITEAGKSALRGELDPEECWNHVWDGKWRMLSFDLPKEATSQRRALRAWLKTLRFGRLQGSVYVTPRPLGDWTEELAKLKLDPSAFVFMTGDFGSSTHNERYVERAWDFKKVNRLYKDYLKFLSKSRATATLPEAFADWSREESTLWRAALEQDPLLPRSLWPDSFFTRYLGPKALQARKKAHEKGSKEILRLFGDPTPSG